VVVMVMVMTMLRGGATTKGEESLRERETKLRRDIYEEDLLLRVLPTARNQLNKGTLMGHLRFAVDADMSKRDGIDRGGPQEGDSGGEWKRGKWEHYHLFPSAVGTIVKKYHVQTFDLTMASGRWNTRLWGSSIVPAPNGAELTAHFENYVPPEEVDILWQGLTRALSGLFCASFSSLTSNSFSPGLALPPASFSSTSTPSSRYTSPQATPSHTRRGVFLAEPVCTENLTPWLKLLPSSRLTSSLAQLANPLPLASMAYKSTSIHFAANHSSCGRGRLTLTLTVVPHRELQHWSLHDLFGNSGVRGSPLASASHVTIDTFAHGRDGVAVQIGAGYEGQEVAPGVVRVSLTGEHDTLFTLRLALSGDGGGDDVTGLPRAVLDARSLYTQMYTIGSGDERGGLVAKFGNMHPSRPVVVRYYTVVPWFLRLYMHSLTFLFSGEGPEEWESHAERISDARLPRGAGEEELQRALAKHHAGDASLYGALIWSSLLPAIDRVRPALVEYVLYLPPGASAVVEVEFETSLLYFFEYPPDAHRGFDFGAGSVAHTFLTPATAEHRARDAALGVSSDRLSPLGVDWPTTGAVEDAVGVYLHYTDTTSVTIPTPDFSMPYNVIVFTSTVIALFFGRMLNYIIMHLRPLRRGEKPDTRRLADILISWVLSFVSRRKPEPASAESPNVGKENHETSASTSGEGKSKVE